MRILKLIASLCLLAPLAHASPDSLNDVRSIIGEWASTEKAISREAVDWEEEKVLLADLIGVAKEKVKRLESEVAESESQMTVADEKRARLLAQNEQIDLQAERIQNFLAQTEEKLRTLNARLPYPLQEELAPLYRRIPADPGETTLSLGERMQTVVSVLTEVSEFNEKITVSESIRDLPTQDGKGSFRTVWIGLGQAYYLASGDAGFGTAEADGWAWHSRPELAGRIREVIALTEGTASAPKLIELPVQLKESTAP